MLPRRASIWLRHRRIPFRVEASPDAAAEAEHTQSGSTDLRYSTADSRLRRRTVLKGSAFPPRSSPTHREAAPRAGGTASKKSKPLTEGQSPSARSGGKAATPPRGSLAEQPRGTVAKQRKKTLRSQQPAEGPRTINDYSRDELVTVLLKGMGKKWWTRDDAIRAAARRLGFRRTGSHINKAFKSAISGAIRRKLLEYEGTMVRRAK